jgi:pyruvate,water dikinase
MGAAAYTRALDELRRDDAGGFGGKSANLGDMLAAGIPVPGGFAVGAGAYRAFVDEAGLGGAISAAVARAQAAGDVAAIAAASKSIDEAMRFAPLPDGVRAEVSSRYGSLADAVGEEAPAVAVRSSALGEDSEDASHAGQQESFLWVRGADQVCDALRDCWVSLFTPQALSYRAARGADEAGAAMGVTIQLMVDAEVSGVMFTCNPVSGDPSMLAVNASWGLGLAVVSGEATPDDYLVSKVTAEVVRETVSSKDVEYVPDQAGRGTVRREVPPERRDRACLGEDELGALLGLARLVERHFGGHQDIEWALERDRSLPDSLLVLQARPVTTLPERTPKLSGSALSLVMGTFGAPSDSQADS